MSDHTPLANLSNRSELEARGLRPVVLWVPDTLRPGFADELRRQLSLVESDSDDRPTLDFIEAAADWSALRNRADATASATGLTANTGCGLLRRYS